MTRQPGLSCLLIIAVLAASSAGSTYAAGASTPSAIAARYLDAMEANDLDAAGRLFDTTSSVFESGGKEGTWAHYREHHLGPENGQIKSFKVTRGEAEFAASMDSSMAFVAWPIEYRIDLKDGKVINSRGTTTFVLVKTEGDYRIRHLHWSSRRAPATK